MHIRFGFDIAYEFPVATPVVLMLHLRPELAPRLVTPEQLILIPDVPVGDFRDGFGNRCTRLTAPAGLLELRCTATIRDSGQPTALSTEAEEWPVSTLPAAVLSFLLPSRYCDVDLLGEVAWSQFNTIPPGWGRVQAVSDWVHQHLRFDYGQARPTRTASQAFEERNGVCRDFTHLAITLCRCLNIPARYATGYLGDIGVPPDPAAMDFSAWMEVYLGGRWHPFDVRHNARRIGHLVIARGRDAADVAFTTSFGPHTLRRFNVTTEEIPASQNVAA
ncbi:MAG: transglutaminase family protein [Undibacterium sp.]|nr:transglutaminase family protein [Opitutaceae bacterium]